MSYLTYEEYKDCGFSEITEVEFDKLLKHASGAIDSVTRYFYQFNDLDDDVEFRRNQFKKAVAAQINYFHAMGGTSSHEINNPLSVQIGRTQMSQGVAHQEKSNKVMADEVYTLLSATGLLYRGISSC